MIHMKCQDLFSLKNQKKKKKKMFDAVLVSTLTLVLLVPDLPRL